MRVTDSAENAWKKLIRVADSAENGFCVCKQLGNTPLHQAAQQGHVLIIKLLLKYRANPDTLTTVSLCFFCWAHITLALLLSAISCSFLLFVNICQVNLFNNNNNNDDDDVTYRRNEVEISLCRRRRRRYRLLVVWLSQLPARWTRTDRRPARGRRLPPSPSRPRGRRGGTASRTSPHGRRPAARSAATTEAVSPPLRSRPTAAVPTVGHPRRWSQAGTQGSSQHPHNDTPTYYLPLLFPRRSRRTSTFLRRYVTLLWHHNRCA